MRQAVFEDGTQNAMNQLVNLLEQRIADSTRSTRPGKFTYIIGNNGTGKSRALGALAEQLSRARPARPVACIANSVHDRFKYTDTGKVRYLGARNQTNAVFLSGIDRQLSRLILRAMMIDPKLFGALCDSVSMEFAFRISDDFETRVTKLLKEPPEERRGRRTKAALFRSLSGARPLSVLRRIHKGSGRFEGLSGPQVNFLLQYLELGIDIQLDVILEAGHRLAFGQLSTGEQNRILTLAKVLSMMEQGAVFLIDEPEVSLHLHWQMKFHQTLVGLLSRLTRFHVVIATHAPIIISEAAKYDPHSKTNLVAILRHDVAHDNSAGGTEMKLGAVSLEQRSFNEVASHDQLVLRYFQAAPYHSREISVEIADAVLNVAEGVSSQKTAEDLLRRLLSTEGLSDEARAQIDGALTIIGQDLAKIMAAGANSALVL